MNNPRFNKKRIFEVGDLVEYEMFKFFEKKNFTPELFCSIQDYDNFHKLLQENRCSADKKMIIRELDEKGELFSEKLILIQKLKLATGQAFFLSYGPSVGYFFVANSEIKRYE